MLKLKAPDLLFLDARLSLDEDAVEDLLELSFLGKGSALSLDQSLRVARRDGDPADEGSGFVAELFANDLFLHDLIRESFTVEIERQRFPVNHGFLYQVLTTPPTELAGIRFRQDIVRELDQEPALLASARALYRDNARLLDLFKTPDHTAQLDIDSHRIDIFRQAKKVIDRMADDFKPALSGLERLAASGEVMRASQAYRRLHELLDYHGRQATLRVDLDIGADGEIHDLRLLRLEENHQNPFHLTAWQRLVLRLRGLAGGYQLSRKVILHRLLQRVYEEVAPALVPLVQVLAHLEVYLAAFGFRERVTAKGYRVCLADVSENQPPQLQSLFNPLLLDADGAQPVPSHVELDTARPILLVTGPNSGGKTRLLQAVGLAQVLGQSGFFTPAASARLPLVRGLFVSLVETETAHSAEGRLGREMMRIRGVFERVGTPAMVILDELCSGTNPSEGIEIFDLVLRLLDRFDSAAYISTHFLDYAADLAEKRPLGGLRFLQVAGEERGLGAFQFVEGVARTSLASATARRLGVTFEELSKVIDGRKTLSSC